VRAVNLLPEGDRVRGPAPVHAKSSRVVLGVLGALLLAVLLVILSQNSITGRKADIAAATQEQKQAEVRASQLGSFGEFSQIKETRVASISTLAKARFDYERLMRELALVLPGDTWVTEVDASSTASPDGTAAATPTPAPTAAPAPSAGASTPAPAASPSTPAAAPATTAAAAAPTVKIVGCAKTQSMVAETMVRLRNLHRVDDVELTDSTRPAAAASAGAASAGAAPSGAAGTPTTGCGNRYSFDATVTFAADTAAALPGEHDTRVPTVLGGGS